MRWKSIRSTVNLTVTGFMVVSHLLRSFQNLSIVSACSLFTTPFNVVLLLVRKKTSLRRVAKS